MAGFIKKSGSFLLSLLLILLILSLSACGASKGQAEVPAPESSVRAQSENTEGQGQETEGDLPESSSDEEGEGSDLLVVYFSRTGEQYSVGKIEQGNTAIVADMIIEKTGADRFEILPEEDDYPCTYDELTDLAKKEQNEKARPSYAGEVPDLSRYSTIFIGSPVWWGDWPMILYTFFETNAEDLSGKTLIPFSTHEGSGLAGFDRKLSSVCSGAVIGEGLAVRGNDAQNRRDSVKSAVNDWLSRLGYGGEG